MNYWMRQSLRRGLAKFSCLYCRPLPDLIAIRLTALSAQAALALHLVHVSYPSPVPYYIPLAVAWQTGFFRDQSLDDEQLTGLNIKDLTLQQLFDFSLLPQVLKESPLKRWRGSTILNV